MTVTHLTTILALLSLLAGPLPATARDYSAADGSSTDPCAALAARALEILQEAEAAEAKQAKVAAYEKSRAVAESVLALDESNADAHFVVFASEGRLELIDGAIPNPVNLYKANERLERVLELDPAHSAGLAAKGGLYRQLPWMLGGDLDKAESYLKQAIELNSQSIGARIELAATYFAMGQRDKCSPLLDEAYALAEKQGKTYRLKEVARLRAQIASQ